MEEPLAWDFEDVDQPDRDTESVERPGVDYGRPVDDGPADHHPNATTEHTATQPSRITHLF